MIFNELLRHYRFIQLTIKYLKKRSTDYQLEDHERRLQCQGYYAQLMEIYLATCGSKYSRMGQIKFGKTAFKEFYLVHF